MKSNVIAQKDVEAELKNFVVAELYTDGKAWKDENNKLLKERFKTSALPLYLTIGPDDKVRSRLVGTASKEEFLEFLRKGHKGGNSSPGSTASK